MKVCVLLPTLNEEESIGDMIKAVRKVSKKYEIWVVDSGSTDGTLEIASKLGVNLFKVSRRGKGFAIACAFRNLNYDSVVLLDSDMSYCPSDIPAMLKALKNDKVVLGDRFSGTIEEGAMSGVNHIGNNALTLIAYFLYGEMAWDMCSGFWAFRKEAYKRMTIDAVHFSLEANFYCQCVKHGFNIATVPITYKKRRGQSKLSIFDGFQIFSYLISKRLMLW